MEIFEVMALYAKSYLKNEEFEQWVYNNQEKLKNEVDEDLYLDLISNSYMDRNDVITLKNKLIRMLKKSDQERYENINDAFIEHEIEDKKNDNIWLILQQRNERKKEMVLDFAEITSANHLQKYIKRKFELTDYYGENWDAFEDLLYGDIKLPYKLVIKNWKKLSEQLPTDAQIFKELIIKYSKDCQIVFN